MADELRVNGNALSWGSLTLKINGERYYGFTAINFSDKRERTKGYGMGQHHAPTRRSRGKYTAELVKLTGWKSSVQAARKALADLSANGTDYGDVEFVMLLQGVEPDDTPIDTEFERCVWAANSAAYEENPDPLKEDFEIDCMLIRRNGLVLFASAVTQP